MLNYKDKDDFLIDISIYPGVSGSPVFIRDFGSEWYEKGSSSVGERTYFIGIVYAMAKYSNKPGLVKEFIATESTSKMEISNLVSNLGFAIKSTKLREFDPIIKKLLSNNSG